MIEGFVHGLLSTGLLSFRDRLRFKNLEKKVMNGNDVDAIFDLSHLYLNSSQYHKLYEITPKVKLLQEGNILIYGCEGLHNILLVIESKQPLNLVLESEHFLNAKSYFEQFIYSYQNDAKPSRDRPFGFHGFVIDLLPFIYYFYGYVLKLEGNYKESITYKSKAIQLEDKLPTVFPY